MLEITHLFKRYPGATTAAVDDVSLKVRDGDLVTLLGPSGCGKSTTLRMIAGLEKPTGGRITIDGQVVFSSEDRIELAANQRPIAMVFQSYAIWPHMDVFNNVAFPLQRGGKFRLSRAEIRERTMHALATVDLADLAKRQPSALSGGQQQRVALARALVTEPKVLLLDEPLSNLDVRLRDQMRETIKELHERAGLTTIFVTHDQNEAMALSDQIVVVNAGKVVETGTPQRVFQRPRHPFTAGFIGKYNVLEGRIASCGSEGTICTTALGDVVAAEVEEDVTEGAEVRVFVRPGSFLVCAPDPSETGIPGTVATAAYQGGFWELKIAAADGNELLVHSSLASAREVSAEVGTDVRLVPISAEVVVVPQEPA